MVISGKFWKIHPHLYPAKGVLTGDRPAATGDRGGGGEVYEKSITNNMKQIISQSVYGTCFQIGRESAFLMKLGGNSSQYLNQAILHCLDPTILGEN